MIISQYGCTSAVASALAESGMHVALHVPEIFPDALVIDVHVPGGLLLLESFTQQWPVTPIIATMKAEMLQQVSPLVDGYVMYDEPAMEEWVVGKLTQVMRRFQPFLRDEHGNLVIAEGLVFVPQRRELVGPLGTVRLSPTESNILVMRLQHKGGVVSPDALAQRVWHLSIPNQNTERVHEHRLERKLEQVFGSSLIETARGDGYILPA